MWFPAPGWPPWDALSAAGVRVTDDVRNLSAPCAVVQIDRVEMVGNCAVQYTVAVRLVAPGPDNADAQKWLWTVAVPPLLPFAGTVVAEEWEGYSTATATIEEGGQQWP